MEKMKTGVYKGREKMQEVS
jgi:hypothetical protein